MRAFSSGLFLLLAVTLELGSLRAAHAGTIGIQPYFDPGTAPRDVIAIRHRTRVATNATPTRKILFAGRRFYTPGNPTTYLLDSNLYSHWLEYEDTGCTPWPPQGTRHPMEAGLWISVPDYVKKGLTGVRQVDKETFEMFPRQSSGVDAIAGLNKIETISQGSVNGKEILIEYRRGRQFTSGENETEFASRMDPENPTQCRNTLIPNTLFQVWDVFVAIETNKYHWEFVLPAESARYLAPSEIMSFVTEFFNEPGFFQVFAWDLAIQRENETQWTPLTTWRMHYEMGGRNNGYGARLANHNGNAAIEFSNDGTDTYVQKGDIFDLKDAPAAPVPPDLSTDSHDPKVSAPTQRVDERAEGGDIGVSCAVQGRRHPAIIAALVALVAVSLHRSRRRGHV